MTADGGTRGEPDPAPGRRAGSGPATTGAGRGGPPGRGTGWTAEQRRELIDALPVGLLVLELADPDDPGSLIVRAANPAAASLLEVPVGGLPGRPFVEVAPLDRADLQALVGALRSDRPPEGPTLHLPGPARVVAATAVRLPAGRTAVVLEDVTSRARQAESLRHQALHDPLTGLPNRALLHERLTRALVRSDRTGDGVALLLVDLNQFKEVNDSLGHAYGDALLKALATRLQTRLRNCDTVARLGGDEFAVLLTTGADGDGALEVARRICRLCEEPVQAGEYRLQVSASVGIALAPEHANDAETLLRRADGAMYRSKGRGGGATVFSAHHELRTIRRLELMAELREATSAEDFVVHYQPRIDLATLRPTGVEALVRWNHPRHGLLPPEEFIELAEVSGAIRLVTRTVTERAARAVRELGSHRLTVTVNLSARNLHDPTLVEWVREVVDRLEVPQGSLGFELTEAQLMEDHTRSRDVLRQLHDLGVRLGVDDFGTGPSSLAALRDLPVDEVKIHPAFVAELEAGDDRMVRTVIALGHQLGLQVVAEGVEGTTALTRLRELGCDLAQGFHLAVPMTLPDLATYLAPTGRPRLGST
jgi:diguanylate cyclase (GGDEF)-like protein